MPFDVRRVATIKGIFLDEPIHAKHAGEAREEHQAHRDGLLEQFAQRQQTGNI